MQIKKISFILLVSFFYLPFAFSYSVYTTTKDKINVRIDSTVSSHSLGYLNKNEEVEAVKARFEWRKIKLPRRFHCYIAQEFTKNVGSNKIKVTASKVNLRANASLESYIIGVASKDAVFYSLGKVDGWIKVRGNPYIYGWVHKKFLKEIDKVSFLASFVKKTLPSLSEPDINKKRNLHAELIKKGKEIIPLLEGHIESADKNTSYSIIWILAQLSQNDTSTIAGFLKKSKTSSLKTASVYLDIIADAIGLKNNKVAYFYLQNQGKLFPEDVENGRNLLQKLYEENFTPQ